ncbi:IS3 family transposase [Stappia albiluteola]
MVVTRHWSSTTHRTGSSLWTRRTYKVRVEVRQDVFDHIEMFYNPKRKHVRHGTLSPVEFEWQQETRTERV